VKIVVNEVKFPGKCADKYTAGMFVTCWNDLPYTGSPG
jgi:hypothetical protein